LERLREGLKDRIGDGGIDKLRWEGIERTRELTGNGDGDDMIGWLNELLQWGRCGIGDGGESNLSGATVESNKGGVDELNRRCG
jgi:hypothetical protein